MNSSEHPSNEVGMRELAGLYLCLYGGCSRWRCEKTMGAENRQIKAAKITFIVCSYKKILIVFCPVK